MGFPAVAALVLAGIFGSLGWLVADGRHKDARTGAKARTPYDSFRASPTRSKLLYTHHIEMMSGSSLEWYIKFANEALYPVSQIDDAWRVDGVSLRLPRSIIVLFSKTHAFFHFLQQ